jgi:cytochrome c-type biogenesis protein
MVQYLEAFVLGNQAILTNVCLLPLYPSLLAFLASDSTNAERGRAWLGAVVLAGVLSTMLLIGFLLFLARQSFGAVLPTLLPIVYGVVIAFGAMLLLGFNPFNRLSTLNVPMLENRTATAFLYGALLAPMTLPCTGPLITSAFVLGASDAGSLIDGLLYFLAFGLGFGWVLAVLPLLAMPLQRRFTRWLTQNYTLLTRFSGVLLIAIGIFGFVTEVIPNA